MPIESAKPRAAETRYNRELMRQLLCILWIGWMVLAAAGCQGWDIGTHWLGDGNSDPDSDVAVSDRGVGRDVARSVIRGTER